MLGYDDDQPLPWLKEMARLKAEDVALERGPIAHMQRGGSGGAEGAELRQRLRAIKVEARANGDGVISKGARL